MNEKTEYTFRPITLEDQGWMREKLKEQSPNACEYTFANNFMWRKAYQVEAAQIAGCGVIRCRIGEEYRYSFPFGAGDRKAAIRCLLEECHKRGQKLFMYPLEDKERELLAEWFPGEFLAVSNRDDFDYVYGTGKLMFLKGRKLQKKRNHIARFKDGDDWRYEPMGADNIEACRQMAKEWHRRREDRWSPALAEEMQALEEAFSHFTELPLVGGVLYKQERVVAFTIGEFMDDENMIVHFEKAFADVQGAYPMINQQFVQHTCGETLFINREEDTGDPGLRKAKLSYYPDRLLKKYMAAESDVVYAAESDQEQITRLWQTCFGDDEAYVSFFLRRRFTPETMLVIHRDGRPVSMASFLPVRLTTGGERVDAYYVYAVATLPEYRGQGFASQILSFAKNLYKKPLLLQVEGGDVALEAFYEKQGFFFAFQKQERQVLATTPEHPSDGEELELDELSAPDVYKKLRDTHFAGEGYVEWEETAIGYALQENQFCGGKAFLVRGGEREDILLCRTEEDGLSILETTLPDKRLFTVLPELCEEMQTTGAYRENGGGMLWCPEGKVADWKPGYLNLTLG